MIFLKKPFVKQVTKGHITWFHSYKTCRNRPIYRDRRRNKMWLLTDTRFLLRVMKILRNWLWCWLHNSKNAKMYWIICTLINELYDLWTILNKALLKMNSMVAGGKRELAVRWLQLQFARWKSSGAWLHNNINALNTTVHLKW